MNFVINLTDRIVVLDFGVKISEGTPAPIKHQSGREQGLSRKPGMTRC